MDGIAGKSAEIKQPQKPFKEGIKTSIWNHRMGMVNLNGDWDYT